MSDPAIPDNASNQKLAEQTAKRVTQETITRLQKAPAVTTDGGDPSLENLWEEVCVQRQDQEFGTWEKYLDVIESNLETVLDGLQHNELVSLWLQTPSGMEWEDEDEPGRGAPSPNIEEVVKYLLDFYVLPEAEEWTNPSVENYLAGGIKDDEVDEDEETEKG